MEKRIQARGCECFKTKMLTPAHMNFLGMARSCRVFARDGAGSHLAFLPKPGSSGPCGVTPQGG